MTREVVAQLRRISGQQSKISRARGQLSVFRQVLRVQQHELWCN
jgi:ribosomal protein L5